jgi:hypothetical protein
MREANGRYVPCGILDGHDNKIRELFEQALIGMAGDWASAATVVVLHQVA